MYTYARMNFQPVKRAWVMNSNIIKEQVILTHEPVSDLYDMDMLFVVSIACCCLRELRWFDYLSD